VEDFYNLVQKVRQNTHLNRTQDYHVQWVQVVLVGMMTVAVVVVVRIAWQVEIAQRTEIVVVMVKREMVVATV